MLLSREIFRKVSSNGSNEGQLPRENTRKDLIWRFIAVIFLAHIGVVDIWQEGQDIMVVKHEVNGKG